MKNLLDLEISQTLKSKSFIVSTFIITVFTFMFMLMAASDGADSGFELFLENCGNINALFQIIMSVFAGIHITGAFESRRIQAAVMAGNSRISILAAKLCSFSVSAAVFYLVPLTVSSAAGFMMYGIGETDGEFFNAVILRSAVHMIAMISFMSAGFVISVYVKNIGAAVGVNLGAFMLMYGMAEYFLTNENLSELSRFTAVGQTMLLLADADTANLLTALAVSVFGIMLSAAAAYLKFSREELK